MSDEPMNDDQDDPLTIRETINANLSQETVERLRLLIDAQGDAAGFRERLVHILTRYEAYKAATPSIPKNERRKQVVRLHDKANGFLATLKSLDSEIRFDLQSRLDFDRLERAFDMEAFSLDTPLPEGDDSLAQAASALTNIIEACNREIASLKASKDAPKTSQNTALNRLLVDLGSLYEAETGMPGKAMCYRDETSPNEYSGQFFGMAKAILDLYAPDSYASPAALGIRILREPYLKADPTD